MIDPTTKRSDSSQEQSLSRRRREKGKRKHQTPGRDGEKRGQDGDGSVTRMAKRNVVEQRWEGRETTTRVEAGLIGGIGVG
jgi:hypothetical protein